MLVKHNPFREAEKIHWGNLWRKARDNMPYKQGSSTRWVEATAEVPLPEFIAARAKDQMQMFNGRVHIKELSKIGRGPLLMEMLGLSTDMATAKVENAIHSGRKPRRPEQQKMIQLLAGPDGTQLAWDYLVKKGNCKHYTIPKSVTR